MFRRTEQSPVPTEVLSEAESFVLAPDSPEELALRLKDPEYLPERADVLHAFGIRDGELPDLETIDRFNRFCGEQKPPIFEFLTKEYVTVLAGYIEQRAREIEVGKARQVQVLEVGAGDGKLTHFLQKQLAKNGLASLVTLIATDNQSWRDRGVAPVFSVEHLNVDKAVKTYNPDIVLCSWMVNDKDFSKAIREHPSVQEYILIGPSHSGVTGDPWETWGSPAYAPVKGELPPYKKDGFTKTELKELSKIQLGKTQFYSGDQSETYSFRRTTQ